MSFDELREIEELLRKIQEKEKRETKGEPEEKEKKETEEAKEETKVKNAEESRPTIKRAQQVLVSFSISDFDRVKREYDDLGEIEELYNYASKRGFKKPSIFSRERRDRFSEYNKNKRKLEKIIEYPSRPFSDSERRKLCKLIKFYGLEGKYGGYCWHIWKEEKEIERKIREWEKIKKAIERA